jgi:hypothetical protein
MMTIPTLRGEAGPRVRDEEIYGLRRETSAWVLYYKCSDLGNAETTISRSNMGDRADDLQVLYALPAQLPAVRQRYYRFSSPPNVLLHGACVNKMRQSPAAPHHRPLPGAAQGRVGTCDDTPAITSTQRALELGNPTEARREGHVLDEAETVRGRRRLGVVYFITQVLYWIRADLIDMNSRDQEQGLGVWVWNVVFSTLVLVCDQRWGFRDERCGSEG